MTIQESKRRQRADGIVARCALEAGSRDAMNHRIAQRVLAMPEFQRAQVLFSYCAMRGEVDPSEIEAEARRMGKCIAYPVCCGNGRMIAAVPDSRENMHRGMYGASEPLPGHYSILSPEQIDLVLVPCTAFDHRCLRVGMGGGYYDRYLRLCSGGRFVALAYEVQKVCFAAAEEHDLFLHAVATERALYQL